MQRVTAGNLQQLTNYARELGGVLDNGALQFLDVVLNCRKEAVQQLHARRYFGIQPEQSTQRNQLYYACEAAETAIMLKCIKLTVECWPEISIAWLHYGLYIQNVVPSGWVREQYNRVADELGFPYVQFAVNAIPVGNADGGNQDVSVQGISIW